MMLATRRMAMKAMMVYAISGATLAIALRMLAHPRKALPSSEHHHHLHRLIAQAGLPPGTTRQLASTAANMDTVPEMCVHAPALDRFFYRCRLLIPPSKERCFMNSKIKPSANSSALVECVRIYAVTL